MTVWFFPFVAYYFEKEKGVVVVMEYLYTSIIPSTPPVYLHLNHSPDTKSSYRGHSHSSTHIDLKIIHFPFSKELVSKEVVIYSARCWSAVIG